MATHGRGRTRSRAESRNVQWADNHAKFIVAMANLANTMEANAAAILQAVQRLGQPAGNGNGNGEGNANDNVEGNGDNMGASGRGPALVSSRVLLATASECRHSLGCIPNGLLQEGAPETYESWKCIKYQRGLKDSIMTAVAPMEIRTFSDLVNKVRVVEEYAKTVASSKETHGGNTSRGSGKYFHPRGQSFKRGGYAPQGQGGFRKNTQNQFQYAKGRGN
ncbi:hypothetical protein AHAS_Ahas03G0214800 [Arachis hypogaea]